VPAPDMVPAASVPIARPPVRPEAAPEVPPLLPFQEEGARMFMASPALLLADDMGLGKTVQAITALRRLAARGDLAEALVVAPAGLLEQWRRELRRFAPELTVGVVAGTDRAWMWPRRAQVKLVSYDTLRSDAGGEATYPRQRVWDAVVLDEAQRIKNAGTATAEVCKRLLRRRAWALTGTPLENTMAELVSVLEFVTPLAPGEAVPRLDVGPELRRRLLDMQLRRRKRDVAPELPPLRLHDVPVELGTGQRAEYDRAEQDGIVHLRALGRSVRITHVLELIVRLKQICNAAPGSGESAKLDDLEERVDTLAAEGHRALIFTQFTDPVFGVAALAERLARSRPVTYTGAMSREERDAAVRRFRDDPDRRILILSLRAGAHGLNLQDASYLFHFDRWWNPAVERQAEGRAHRLGQDAPVDVYRYTCLGTIEERIADVLARKQLLFDEIVDGVSLDVRERLTAAELFGLFDMPAASG